MVPPSDEDGTEGTSHGYAHVGITAILESYVDCAGDLTCPKCEASYWSSGFALESRVSNISSFAGLHESITDWRWHNIRVRRVLVE